MRASPRLQTERGANALSDKASLACFNWANLAGCSERAGMLEELSAAAAAALSETRIVFLSCAGA